MSRDMHLGVAQGNTGNAQYTIINTGKAQYILVLQDSTGKALYCTRNNLASLRTIWCRLEVLKILHSSVLQLMKMSQYFCYKFSKI